MRSLRERKRIETDEWADVRGWLSEVMDSVDTLDDGTVLTTGTALTPSSTTVRD